LCAMMKLTDQQELEKRNFHKNFGQSWYFDATYDLNATEHLSQCQDRWPRDDKYSWRIPNIYYYLDHIMRDNPETIYDIGCANQLMKKIFKDKVNIVGIDPYGDQADQKLDFNEFAKLNKHTISHAFAINSIHYTCITRFKARLLQFFSIFKKGGLGFVTLNIEKLIANTNDAVQIRLFGSKIDQHNWKLAYDYVQNELAQLMNDYSKEIFDSNAGVMVLRPLEFILVEMLPEYYSNHMDGNVRIIFRVNDLI